MTTTTSGLHSPSLHTTTRLLYAPMQGTSDIEHTFTIKLCRRGQWNERMLIEPVLSLVHRVCRPHSCASRPRSSPPLRRSPPV